MERQYMAAVLGIVAESFAFLNSNHAPRLRRTKQDIHIALIDSNQVCDLDSKVVKKRIPHRFSCGISSLFDEADDWCRIGNPLFQTGGLTNRYFETEKGMCVWSEYQ